MKLVTLKLNAWYDTPFN